MLPDWRLRLEEERTDFLDETGSLCSLMMERLLFCWLLASSETSSSLLDVFFFLVLFESICSVTNMGCSSLSSSDSDYSSYSGWILIKKLLLINWKMNRVLSLSVGRCQKGCFGFFSWRHRFWRWRCFRILFGVVLLFTILSSKGLLFTQLLTRLSVRRFPSPGLCTDSFRRRGCQWCTIFWARWSSWRRWGCVGFPQSCRKSRAKLMWRSCRRWVFMCGCLERGCGRLRGSRWQGEMRDWPRTERLCGPSGTCCPQG